VKKNGIIQCESSKNSRQKVEIEARKLENKMKFNFLSILSEV
jgi:hypothetical protein